MFQINYSLQIEISYLYSNPIDISSRLMLEIMVACFLDESGFSFDICIKVNIAVFIRINLVGF